MVRFLVIRFSSIGDIVLTTPVVRHLKEQVEGARIHYLTKKAYAPLLRSNPHIDAVHVLEDDLGAVLKELRQVEFDYIIDLHHNLRSARVKRRLKRMDFSVDKLNFRKWMLVNLKRNRLPDRHMVDRNLDTVAPFLEFRDEKGLDYFLPREERVDLATLPPAFSGGYVGLAIGAQHETKKMPVDMLAALVSRLPHPVVVLGGPEDRTAGEELIRQAEALDPRRPEAPLLNACGSCTIHQSASLVEQCRVLITHDTGLMHVGAAFGKPILSLWGNTVPAFGMTPYRAHPDSAIFEVPGLSCRPCSKIGHQKCPKGHFDCMRRQDPESIASAARDLFQRLGPY
ncbi:MAG: glycosyltransferase family 9 protein [Bacteroidales bacterium]